MPTRECAVKILCLCVFVPLLLVGCEASIDQKKLDELGRDVQDTISKATKKIGELTPSSDDVTNLTTEEVAKLFNFEYRVIDLEASLPNSEIELQLSRLGLDRWECFHIEKNGPSLRVFCKRRPKTFLRYMQHVPFL